MFVPGMIMPIRKPMDRERAMRDIESYSCPRCGEKNGPCIKQDRDGSGRATISGQWPFHQARLDAFWSEHATSEYLREEGV